MTGEDLRKAILIGGRIDNNDDDNNDDGIILIIRIFIIRIYFI